jgi:hypothetical protein
MANRQIIDYIKEAQGSDLKKAEILHNLKEAGWSDEEVRDAFSYISLYESQPWVSSTSKNNTYTASPITASMPWVSLVAACIGFVWLISGTNKILSDKFVSGFADFVQGQITDGQAPTFYKSILNNFILPQAALVSRLIQYSELAIGLTLVIAGIWHFLRKNKGLNFLLCLASIASALMILNIILSLGMPLPWVDRENVFAQGVSIEYLMLLISIVLSGSYFWDL